MELETITPLFIGSGELYSGIDYFERGTYVYFVDFNKILKEKVSSDIKTESEKIALFISRNLYNNRLENKDQFYTNDLINKIIEKNLYELRLESENPGMLRNHSNEIRVFTKTRGKPYIPGSSLKGALRTAILFDAVDEISYDKLWQSIKSFNHDLEQQFKSAIEMKYRHLYPDLRLLDKDDFLSFFFNKLSVSDTFLDGKGTVRRLQKFGMGGNNYRNSNRSQDIIVIESYEGRGEVDIKSPISFPKLRDIVNNYTLKALDYLSNKVDFKASMEIVGLCSQIEKNQGLYILLGGFNGWFTKTLHEKVIGHPNFKKGLQQKLRLGQKPGYSNNCSRDFPKTYNLTLKNQVLGIAKII
jgi:CRISPR-associated protein Csm5